MDLKKTKTMTQITAEVKNTIIKKISNIPELTDVGIGFIGNNSCEIWKASAMPEGLRSWIVITVEENGKVKQKATSSGAPKHSLMSELFQVGINCGSALLAGSATVTSTGLAPLSGGTSLPLTYILAAGTVATSAQCGFSLGRVVNFFIEPSNNDVLDDNIWVNKTMLILDALSI